MTAETVDFTMVSSGAPIENRDIGQTSRLYYLDWLRVLAILVVFIFHCAKIFDYHTTGVFNEIRSPFWSTFREGVFIWIMPLFFAISGASVFLSMKPGTAWPFIKSRIKRLLIPLLLVGTFLVNPLWVYAERLFSGQTGENFLLWYPHYFDGMYRFGGNFAPLGFGTHLWYLQSLFIYSLILLPFFMRSKKRMAGGLKTLSNRFEKPWALALLFLPISICGAGFEILGLGPIRVMGGWDPLSYLLFFGYGYMIYSNTRIQETINRYGLIFLAAAAVLTAIYVDSHFGFNLIIPGVTRHDMSAGGELRPLNHSGWVAVQAFRGILAWGWIIGLLGLGYKVLNFNHKFLKYGNEAVLPFYVLHQSVILLVGCYVVKWSSGVQTKFGLIAAISFTIIMAVYELLIRRVNILRFLFGMKLETRGAKPAPVRERRVLSKVKP